MLGDINAALSLLDRLKKWRHARDNPAPETIAPRFVRLFAEHGVHRNQIPRLLGHGLQLSDMRDDTSLLAALNDAQLDAACTLFGIRREWWDGVDARLYEARWCYKAPENFFAELTRLETPATVAPLRAFTTAKPLDYRTGVEQRLQLVLVETVGWLGDTEIHCYRPFTDGWDWAFTESRLQLKALIRAYGKYPVPLFKVSPEQMDLLYSGQLVPGPLLHGSLLSDPSLEDYCMSRMENVQAKETEELERVAEYQAMIQQRAPTKA